MPRPEFVPVHASKSATKPHAAKSLPYAEIRTRRFGSFLEPTSSLEILCRTIPRYGEKVILAPKEKAQALSFRASRRAFDGAPPTIPHDIDQKHSGSCLACHEKGIRLEGKIAPVMSHTVLNNCTQCHVTSTAKLNSASSTGINSFIGLESPRRGARVWKKAPPTIPHQMAMRSDCSSCHGLNGLSGIRTTHPERQNCVQCHVPQERLLP